MKIVFNLIIGLFFILSLNDNVNSQIDNSGIITEAEFRNAIVKNGYPSPSKDKYIGFATQLRSVGGITTRREAAMFLSN
jgi:hypothetical protein